VRPPQGGEFINSIKDKTHAKINVDKQAGDFDERIVHIESFDT
jgi:hypothetical protein